MDNCSNQSHRAYAGEKRASMQRRSEKHDYRERRAYMITIVTEGRRPLLGRVVGRSDGLAGTTDTPRTELTELGVAVEKCWNNIPLFYPEIRLLRLKMMPDHLHGILFVTRHMEQHLGQVIGGFKTGCNKAYRQWAAKAGDVVAMPQHTQPLPQQPLRRPPREAYDRHHGLLFAPGYNDKILLRQGQLQVWMDYLADNPRRLLLKREHPDLFRVRRDVQIAGHTFSAIGNLFLAQRPLRMQVQCSRSLSQAEIEAYKQRMLAEARGGAVLVSPSISPGEKATMRAAFDAGMPLIFLQENGLTDLAKPGGARMDACARGQLLILAPWEHHNKRTVIARTQCLSLNAMSASIATTR